MKNKIINLKNMGLALLFVLAIALAWYFRFVQDDAFISFRYAKNLVIGQGLTWNNLHIEGYTNFLWVLLMAIPEFFQTDTVIFSQIMGIFFYFLTLLVTLKLCNNLYRSDKDNVADKSNVAPKSNIFFKSMVTLFLLLSNYSVMCYATGGLETSLQTFLITLSFLLVIELKAGESSSFYYFLASIVSALAIMTRLDSAVLLVLFLLFSLYRKQVSKVQVFNLLFPFTLIVGSWLCFKLTYYGNILPNSFYAKTGAGFIAFENGLIYVARFFHWYLLWPFLLGWVILVCVKRKAIHSNLYKLIAAICLWLSYVALVGGDFMEFRFIIPISPLIFILTTQAIFDISKLAGTLQKFVCVVMIITICMFSWRHATYFVGESKNSLDCINDLQTFYRIYPKEEWGLIGRKFKEFFKNEKILFALRPVGTVAYYSDLTIFDMWGVNDPYIARHGVKIYTSSFRPGHVRGASFAYMKELGVDVIIDHPVLVGKDIVSDPRATTFLKEWATRSKSTVDKKIENVIVFCIPLDEERGLLAMQINKNIRLSQIINENKWEQTQINF